MKAIYASTVSQEAGLLNEVSDSTWANALALTSRELRELGNDDSASQASEILDCYLKLRDGVEPVIEVADLIAGIADLSDEAGTSPTTTLMSSWTSAATADHAFDLARLFEHIDAAATKTVDVIGPPLNAALSPTGPAPLRDAARDSFLLLSHTPVGDRVLNTILGEQISQVQYNAAGLDVLATHIIMLCNLPSFAPREDLLTSLTEKCRQQLGYGTGQQEMLTMLSEVDWPDGPREQALESLASQAGQLTSDHAWGILRQLARNRFTIPDGLRTVLVDILATEGDTESRSQIAVQAAAHLPVGEATNVALRLELGPKIVARVDADMGEAFGNAVTTMINNPDRRGTPSAIQTLAAIAQEYPENWAQQMAERIDSEMGGDPIAPEAVWRDIVTSASGPVVSVIIQRAGEALDEDPPSDSEFIKAAIFSSSDVQQACMTKLLDAVAENNEERTRALAQLLNLTAEAREKAMEALKPKRNSAARAAKAALSGEDQDS